MARERPHPHPEQRLADLSSTRGPLADSPLNRPSRERGSLRFWSIQPLAVGLFAIWRYISQTTATVSRQYSTVKKVNGKEIKSLDDLAEAVKQPVEGFIKIETEEDPKQIELDASQVTAEAPALQENYGISSLQRLQ